MGREAEKAGSSIGIVAGAIEGAKYGSHVGVAFGGPAGAVAGTVPGAITGAIVGGLVGNKIGTEIDNSPSDGNGAVNASECVNGIKRNIDEAINSAKSKLEDSKLMDNIKLLVLNDAKTRKKFKAWAKSNGNDTLRMSKVINENPWIIFDFLLERGAELTAYFKEYEDVLDDTEVKMWDATKGILDVIKDTMETEDGFINKTVGIAKDIAKYIVFLFVQALCVITKIIKVAWKCVKAAGFFIGTYVLKMVKGIFSLICEAVKKVINNFKGTSTTEPVY